MNSDHSAPCVKSFNLIALVSTEKERAQMSVVIGNKQKKEEERKEDPQ